MIIGIPGLVLVCNVSLSADVVPVGGRPSLKLLQKTLLVAGKMGRKSMPPTSMAKFPQLPKVRVPSPGFDGLNGALATLLCQGCHV